MKKIVALSVIIFSLVALSGCSLIRPRAIHRNWEWDGVPRVMPNSIFTPLSRAHETKAMPALAEALPRTSLREELSLDGPWRYQPDPDEKGETQTWFAPGLDDSSWGTMTVPNNFTVDDVSLKNFYKPVWFRRAFEVPASFSGKHLRLKFEAVDYFAKVWINGELLGEHEGYFNPFEFDITGKVKPGKNIITVKVTNPWDVAMQVAQEHIQVATAEKIWVKAVFAFHDSRMGGDSGKALDSQSFGTGGICRPVKIVATGDVAVNWLLISPRLFDNYTRAELTFDVFVTNFTSSPKTALIQLETQGENFPGYVSRLDARAELSPGPNKVQLTLKVDQPRLWWPWSHPELGATSLYKARLAVTADNKVTDEREEVFGIKEVKLDEQGPEAFFWYLNGKRISFRGTNGIPTEYVSKYTPLYLDDYFRKIKENNMDVLIVHDHLAPPMLYEKADREGVAILQNFTLIWEVNVCDFERPNGDPRLTGNAEVMGRMAAEAIWYLYNHPSIMWWSMHDESAHIEFKGHGLVHGNFCRPEPYKMGEEIPVYQDLSLNLDLDNQLIRIASSLNPTIPMHRTGGLETDSVTWYGWYKTKYWDLLKDPERFPLEYGGEAVSYSLAGVMRYLDHWWPIDEERTIKEWQYHAHQVFDSSANIGRSTAYRNFNEWAFASQLYQAVVIKYHTEINRENMYHPTGSVIQYMYNDWWPGVNFGFADWNLEEKLSLSWMKRTFTPQLVATRVGKNIYSSGEKIEIPLHLMNNDHVNFAGARVDWRLVEETDSFIIRGSKRSTSKVNLGTLLSPMSLIKSVTFIPTTATIGHGIPVAVAQTGEFTVDLPPDAHVPAGTVKLNAPEIKGEQMRHFTLYMTLTSADGKVLCENWDHFIAVRDAKRFKPEEGISPAPGFSLTLDLRKAGSPLSGESVLIQDKYSPEIKYDAKLDHSGKAGLTNLLPGAYRLCVAGLSYEFLLNRDERLELDFTPELKTTLGTKPIIAWKDELQEP